MRDRLLNLHFLVSWHHALGRSWFPKREEGGSSGGAGNSVSESMLEYKLNLPDNGRVISVASHVKHIKRVCR